VHVPELYQGGVPLALSIKDQSLELLQLRAVKYQSEVVLLGGDGNPSPLAHVVEIAVPNVHIEFFQKDPEMLQLWKVQCQMELPKAQMVGPAIPAECQGAVLTACQILGSMVHFHEQLIIAAHKGGKGQDRKSTRLN